MFDDIFLNLGGEDPLAAEFPPVPQGDRESRWWSPPIFNKILHPHFEPGATISSALTHTAYISATLRSSS